MIQPDFTGLAERSACKTCQKLKHRMQADLKIYMGSVAGLNASGKDFDAVYLRAQRTKLAFETARDEFKAHGELHDSE